MSDASLPRMEFSERGVFTLVVLAFVLILVSEAMAYPYRARLAPLTVGIPTAALLIYQALLDWFPRLAAHRGVEGEDVVAGEASIAASDSTGVAILHRRELSIALWLGGLLAGTTLLGILTTMPVFAFAYLRFWARETLTLSIIYACFLWASVHLLLVELLSAQLPVPVLFEWLAF